jgi:hypothetical protein
MTDLTSEEKSLVFNLLKESEAARHTRQKFLAIVSFEFDRLEFDAARRSLVFGLARQRAEISNALASDTVENAQVEDARRALKDSAARVASAPWRAVVRERWPAPIAHEIERLFDEMVGRRLPSGERLDPSADSALLQMKDAFEVLIKFTATVLMRALIVFDHDSADWARRQLFRRGLSLRNAARGRRAMPGRRGFGSNTDRRTRECIQAQARSSRRRVRESPQQRDRSWNSSARSFGNGGARRQLPGDRQGPRPARRLHKRPAARDGSRNDGK